MQHEIARHEFCLFRVPVEGKRVLWQITNRCNYRCVYCVFGSGPGSTLGELTTQQAFNVLEQLREHNFTHLKLTGGEPFTRRDIMEILEYAAGLGLSCDISTNAAFINSERAARLAKLDLEFVHVSVDGPDAPSHEFVRGAHTFAPTVRGIEHLVSHGVKVRIGTALYQGTDCKIEQMTQWCAGTGASEVIFSRMEAAGRLAANSQLLSQLSDDEISAQILNARATYGELIIVSSNFKQERPVAIGGGKALGRCPGGSRFLFIDHLGRISPCSWLAEKSDDYRSRESLGSLSLQSLLDSQELQNFSNQISDERRAGCPLRW